jgi:hypothetical protein
MDKCQRDGKDNALFSQERSENGMTKISLPDNCAADCPLGRTETVNLHPMSNPAEYANYAP